MPATTNFRPSTDRQLHLINGLLAERNMGDIPEDLRVLIGRASAGNMSVRDTSSLIDRLMATPRAGRSNASVMQRAANDGEIVNTPSVRNRAGRMLLAGGIEATVTLPNGEHMTFRVNTRHRVGRGWANCAPTDEGARTTIKCLGTRVGWVNVTDEGWKLTVSSRNVRVKDALRALFGYAAGARDETGQMGAYRVQEASRCGRCLRTLTDPVSIERGIGPECFGRTTGSHHAAVNREVARAANPVAVTREAITLAADAVLTPAPATRITEIAANFAAAQPQQLTAEVQRARDLIAEALDAYATGSDARFALSIFDRLARS